MAVDYGASAEAEAKAARMRKLFPHAVAHGYRRRTYFGLGLKEGLKGAWGGEIGVAFRGRCGGLSKRLRHSAACDVTLLDTHGGAAAGAHQRGTL